MDGAENENVDPNSQFESIDSVELMNLEDLEAQIRNNPNIIQDEEDTYNDTNPSDPPAVISPDPNEREQPQETPAIEQIEETPATEHFERQLIASSPIQSPSKKKRKINSPNKMNKSQIQDDGSICNICFEIFSTGGNHRIVSLKCGHIFGEDCILKWLKEQKSCPQCKTRSSQRDFRPIYASKIIVVDNFRELELEQKLQKYEREKVELDAKTKEYLTTINIQKNQIRDLKRENERLLSSRAAQNLTSPTTCVQIIKGGKMYLEKNIDFKESSESKLVSYMCKSRKILISQKSTTTLFSGFGIRFIDAVQQRAEKFINTGAKVICDFSFDSTETFILSVSREKTCKMVGVDSRQSSLVFSPPDELPLWSCAFNKSNANQVILGNQSGVIHIYDTKNTSIPLVTCDNPNDKSPIKFILAINNNDIFPHGGFVAVHVRGIYFYEFGQSAEHIEQTKLNVDCSIFTASYDDKTEMLLITTATEPSFHIVGRLTKVVGVPVLSEIYRFANTHIDQNIPVFTRPAQIKVPDGFIVASYTNKSKDLQIHTPSVDKMHSIVSQNVISDICPLYNNDNGIVAFAAVAPTKCRIYKVNLEYR